ncbi:MAG: SCP2 sterol-binding domain-containing protein, partial [Myxococcota bacterium]
LAGEGGGTWIVAIRDGKIAVDRAAGERAGAGATVRADAASYLRIVNGELSGAEAFSTRQLVSEGDLAQVARIAQLGLV